ncbi:FMN-binding negative transcriptional regulator [Flavobacterium soyangense]|uniref:FMN-binding negative transcriptional regulator n=1 Tax=Flavobacterium soyangense TaxID=2023265 RepID=A0A930U8I5_9FLAO|nr:FMN-binding negative transcriptional regulator [Flavobacterium soyangense]MBF2708681.1 FMN-binding negative transcriptional regulator [Flavobacterium soyangense]
MYRPEIFKITDRSIIKQFIKENGFGTLISIGETYPIGTSSMHYFEYYTDCSVLMGIAKRVKINIKNTQILKPSQEN